MHSSSACRIIGIGARDSEEVDEGSRAIGNYIAVFTATGYPAATTALQRNLGW